MTKQEGPRRTPRLPRPASDFQPHTREKGAGSPSLSLWGLSPQLGRPKAVLKSQLRPKETHTLVP